MIVIRWRLRKFDQIGVAAEIKPHLRHSARRDRQIASRFKHFLHLLRLALHRNQRMTKKLQRNQLIFYGPLLLHLLLPSSSSVAGAIIIFSDQMPKR